MRQNRYSNSKYAHLLKKRGNNFYNPKVNSKYRGSKNIGSEVYLLNGYVQDKTTTTQKTYVRGKICRPFDTIQHFTKKLVNIPDNARKVYDVAKKEFYPLIVDKNDKFEGQYAETFAQECKKIHLGSYFKASKYGPIPYSNREFSILKVSGVTSSNLSNDKLINGSNINNTNGNKNARESPSQFQTAFSDVSIVKPTSVANMFGIIPYNENKLSDVIKYQDYENLCDEREKFFTASTLIKLSMIHDDYVFYPLFPEYDIEEPVVYKPFIPNVAAMRKMMEDDDKENLKLKAIGINDKIQYPELFDFVDPEKVNKLLITGQMNIKDSEVAEKNKKAANKIILYEMSEPSKKKMIDRKIFESNSKACTEGFRKVLFYSMKFGKHFDGGDGNDYVIMFDTQIKIWSSKKIHTPDKLGIANISTYNYIFSQHEMPAAIAQIIRNKTEKERAKYNKEKQYGGQNMQQSGVNEEKNGPGEIKIINGMSTKKYSEFLEDKNKYLKQYEKKFLNQKEIFDIAGTSYVTKTQFDAIKNQMLSRFSESSDTEQKKEDEDEDDNEKEIDEMYEKNLIDDQDNMNAQDGFTPSITYPMNTFNIAFAMDDWVKRNGLEIDRDLALEYVIRKLAKTKMPSRRTDLEKMSEVDIPENVSELDAIKLDSLFHDENVLNKRFTEGKNKTIVNLSEFSGNVGQFFKKTVYSKLFRPGSYDESLDYNEPDSWIWKSGDESKSSEFIEKVVDYKYKFFIVTAKIIEGEYRGTDGLVKKLDRMLEDRNKELNETMRSLNAYDESKLEKNINGLLKKFLLDKTSDLRKEYLVVLFAVKTNPEDYDYKLNEEGGLELVNLEKFKKFKEDYHLKKNKQSNSKTKTTDQDDKKSDSVHGKVDKKKTIVKKKKEKKRKQTKIPVVGQNNPKKRKIEKK